MCTVLLPPGDNTVTVNKYININKAAAEYEVAEAVHELSAH